MGDAMAFDIQIWRERIAQRMDGWETRWEQSRAAGVSSLYAFLSAMALWPVVEAVRQGDLAAVLALGSVAAGVGGNLLANQIQSWKDEADAARRLAQTARENQKIRAALDAVLERLEVVAQAQTGLSESERVWFAETLRREVADFGGTLNVVDGVQIQVEGSGAIAQGPGAVAAGAGGVVVGGNVDGDVIVIADPDVLWRAIQRRPPATDLRRATEHYLTCLVDRYRYLDFKGMGISDRVPLRLPLVEMYVPLKARIELPEGETWARGLRLAGRKVPDTEQAALSERLSEPRPVLDLLRENSGLIIVGDPGAGKTTFLKYLTLKLAAGEEDLGLEVRLPVLVPLSAYANALVERDVRLDDFVASYFHDLGADLPIGSMLEEALKQGGALVLLDGLDEVKDVNLRRTVVERVVDFYTFHRRAGNRFVLTSRVVGYREVRPTVEGLAECTLVDLGDEEIQEFVDKWTAALERAARGSTQVATFEAERERRELLEAVQRNPGVRGLAANPLLLTILALMKRQGVTLPERRVELYDQYVRTLLSSWNRARGLGRPPARDLDVVETVRILASLALWMHEASPGVGLVKQGDLLRELGENYRQRGETDAERVAQRFVADVREYAGLLLERGAGQYGFIHLTFEEYLAAVGIARLGQREIEPIVDILSDHVGDPAWREVALLTVGYMGVVQQWEKVSSDVVEALVAREPGEPGQAVVLAGEAVVDAWPGGVTPACKGTIVQALMKTLRQEEVKPSLRAAAGRALAKLGDPRPGLGVDLETGLPDVLWCYVPPGPFIMGEGEEQHRNERITEGYLISRYPVTNAQFAAFIGAGGYRNRRYWTKAGWEWREQEGRTGPDDRGEPFNLPNHPVVGVTWYEGVAFCRWLLEQVANREWRVWRNGQLEVRRVKPQNIAVRLPSEAEWEKAARGVKGQRYPWGDDPDPNRANYDKARIRTTSAVGCFPGGVSPYGVEDLSGNVWEWCQTKWEGSYKGYRGDNDLKGSARRVLRGGGFRSEGRGVRCAFRLRNNPLGRNRDLGFRLVASPVHL